MAAMTRTQREHLLRLLRQKASKAWQDKIVKEFRSKLDLYDMDISDFIEQIKNGRIVERPNLKDRHVGSYVVSKLIYANEIKAMLEVEREEARVRELRKTLEAEIDSIESRLIFEEVSGVDLIMADFDRKIKQLISAK